MCTLRISDVVRNTEIGEFHASEQVIGWCSDRGHETVYPLTSIRKAEWHDGELRFLCEVANASKELTAFSGFSATDFPVISMHLEKHCGVILRKHRQRHRTVSEDFLAQLWELEMSAAQVGDAYPGTVQKQAKESDLLSVVEETRDCLDQMVGGDKMTLSEVFAANNCELIGRLRLVLSTLQLETYARDQRIEHLHSLASTVEAVLKSSGHFRQWIPPTGGNDESANIHGVFTRNDELAKFSVDRDREESFIAQKYLSWDACSSIDVGTAQKCFDDAGSSCSTGSAPDPAKDTMTGAENIERDDEEILCQSIHEYPESFLTEEVVDPNNSLADPEIDENMLGLRARFSGPSRGRYMHPDSIMEGWVWKRSRFLKRWRRRYLVLVPSLLSCFRAPGDRCPTESARAIEFNNVCCADGCVKKNMAFCVSVIKRKYFMVCDTDGQKSAWMSAISEALRCRPR
uniref:PH domain-containing protein n=1 Tax=Noctiluca scintillans TaxID=2966 RepID=A0A7S0ZVI3_NOCSC|mmetsp:Transcript_20461/g.54837  ORF Transcript_20461/g.54837 Transcript_20461/m.54837 type:complete len:459 (+) Transcript_20461:86-1462(+)